MRNIVSLMYYAYYNPIGSLFMIKRDHIPMKSPQPKQITCMRTIPLNIRFLFWNWVDKSFIGG